jgi:hypothetical protein
MTSKDHLSVAWLSKFNVSPPCSRAYVSSVAGLSHGEMFGLEYSSIEESGLIVKGAK